MLEARIPVLDGNVPPAAAKTAKGCTAVVAWFKTLKNHSGLRKLGDPMTTYDFGWLWRELEVEMLRR